MDRLSLQQRSPFCGSDPAPIYIYLLTYKEAVIYGNPHNKNHLDRFRRLA